LKLKQEIRHILNELDGAMYYLVMVNFMERIIAWLAWLVERIMCPIFFFAKPLTPFEKNNIFVMLF
jgi:hypothetical protein